MQITDVTTIKLLYPMAAPMADAIHYMPERPLLLVQVHTDDGIIGIGEAAVYGGFMESTEALILGELRRTLIGQDPFRVERLWSMMATRAHQRAARCPLPPGRRTPAAPARAGAARRTRSSTSW